MKVKIVSDSTNRNTKVVNVETGEVIENVTHIFWEAKLGSITTAHIEILGCPIEAEAEGKIIKK